MAASNTIVAVVTDLMFQSRLREQAASLGRAFASPATLDGVREALAAGAALAIVDLHVDDIDWRAAVALAQERAVPVLAFGRHTEAELLRAAREAGCDRVVPRSTLVAELPELIEQLSR